ncbi:VRR-NUC domain-containing protein [Pseudomonas argentinensis]|uniref:VRR-NUC domain-containing protein n=2 Tax=Phytopseudomonas argentinensis TaxID=289370 RepID=A0A1I3NTN6_9GAMM|nr:VRR-NUC domain-containing protein [Pseudomonas argentinensis]
MAQPIKKWQLAKPSTRRPAVDYEGMEQAALFRWLQVRHPVAAGLAYHVPNGGHRVKAVAAKLKVQGVKAGVSDIVLPMARGGFFGLYIEFKAAAPHSAALSETQRAFLHDVQQQGYKGVVCRGMDEAMKVIEAYLASAPTVAMVEGGGR